MIKNLILSAVALSAINLSAGDWGKAPVMPKAPIEECYDVGGSITAGYMTDFIFRGTRFTRDIVYTNVSYTADLLAPVTFSALYANETRNGTGGVQDMLILTTSAAVGTYAGFDTTIGYTHYFFPELGPNLGSHGDIFIDLTRSLGIVDLHLGSDYQVAGGFADGWYHRASLSKTFGITDAMSLILEAGVGYKDHYFAAATNTSGFSHYFATATVPIQLNCRTTINPFISYNGSIDQNGGVEVTDNLINPNGDVLSGGVSITVSF